MPPLSRPGDFQAAPFLASRVTRNQATEMERARLAAWYADSVRYGGDRNPARTLATRFPETSYKTWANIFSLFRTRQPALLTAAPRRGVAGGELTQYALRLLNRPHDLEFVLPVELQRQYEDTRESYAAPVRRERRTAPPRRSNFISDDAYNRAFEDSFGDPDGVWFHEVPIGPETFEDPEDWWLDGATYLGEEQGVRDV